MVSGTTKETAIQDFYTNRFTGIKEGNPELAMRLEAAQQALNEYHRLIEEAILITRVYG